jgi:hypothetical protein
VLIFVVLAGVPQLLFGFDAHQLVGQPLSQCVDIFSDWKHGHGEELSLLELLVTQVMATSSQSKTGSGCSAWRVGVHRPVAGDHHDDAVSGTFFRPDLSVCICGQALHSIGSLVMNASFGVPVTARNKSCAHPFHAGFAVAEYFARVCHLQGGGATNRSSLLRALQPNRVQPACMKLEPMLQDASGLLIDDDSADSTPILKVCCKGARAVFEGIPAAVYSPVC